MVDETLKKFKAIPNQPNQGSSASYEEEKYHFPKYTLSPDAGILPNPPSGWLSEDSP
jgi:hypothetical protein